MMLAGGGSIGTWRNNRCAVSNSPLSTRKENLTWLPFSSLLTRVSSKSFKITNFYFTNTLQGLLQVLPIFFRVRASTILETAKEKNRHHRRMPGTSGCPCRCANAAVYWRYGMGGASIPAEEKRRTLRPRNRARPGFEVTKLPAFPAPVQGRRGSCP